MIPTHIKKKHIIEAIKEATRKGIPPDRISRKFLLEHEGKFYPPKYIVSLANKYACGKTLDPWEFSGGIETNDFLRNLGFKVIKSSSAGKIPLDEVKRVTRARPDESKHNERCPACKDSIEKLLRKAYGKVKPNYRVEIGTHPDDFKGGAPYYESLRKIFSALQNYRGFTIFVKTRTLPNCDFFVPSPGFILEFDESQHFTKPRAMALGLYPADLKLGFDKQKWIKRCMELEAEDNDPPYRDEQRAWYDTLRDFCALILGIPTLRVLPEEARWCKFNVNAEEDIKRFKDIVEYKLALYYENRSSDKSFSIGLAFPELNRHDADYFCRVVKRSSKHLDLIIFPEGFESIRPTRNIKPENIADDPQVKTLLKNYMAISKWLKTGVIVGFEIDYRNTLTSGGGNDQYCILIGDDEKPYIYHKHSTSRYNAFFDSTWSIEKNFIVTKVSGKNIGISVCHDSYISLIPRLLRKKGAEVWVNISYQNVRPSIWEPIHHARAVENGFISICTLHRNSGKGASNLQPEPYAFAEEGKIMLFDLESNQKIFDIPFENRPGKIYIFDTYNYGTTPARVIEETDLSRKAEPLMINSPMRGRTSSLSDSKFIFKGIDIKTFIKEPERLWQVCLDNKDRVVLFFISVQRPTEWEQYRGKIMNIIKGRTIEFSTLFLFLDGSDNVLLAAYRSSNYKDCRVFYPAQFPFKIDKRYLKGLQSTYNISLTDSRNEDDNIYFQKVEQIVNFGT